MEHTKIALGVLLACAVLSGLGGGLALFWIWLVGNTIWAVAGAVGTIALVVLVVAIAADLSQGSSNVR